MEALGGPKMDAPSIRTVMNGDDKLMDQFKKFSSEMSPASVTNYKCGTRAERTFAIRITEFSL